MHLPMLEVQVQSLDQEDPLEDEMAPFGIVAWRIPGTEEPMGYNSWAHKELDTTEQLTYIYTYGKRI